MAETAYARCGDLSIAYQVFGEGPTDLVFSGSFITHIELMWASPETKAWFDRLASFCRVLIFDKAGVGLSDPVAKVRSIEERADEIEAVMDAAGFERCVLMGLSEGGPASIFFAAARPEKVQALVLTGAYPWTGGLSWDDVDRDPEELRARLLPEVGPEYAPESGQIAQIQAFARAVLREWGSGEALRILVPSLKPAQVRGMMERMSASPGMAKATVEALFQIDVRPLLPSIKVPTLVVHATHEVAPIQFGRLLADRIPDAQFVEISGTDHAPWFADPDGISTAIETFLTGARSAPRSTKRTLQTVLFTDIVGSTAQAATLGDDRWRAVLERFGEISAELTVRFGGRVVKSTGDGYLASFEGPTSAIRCAQALVLDVQALGVHIRAGLHTGECELLGDDLGGIAVHIAARILEQAGTDQVVASGVVRDLVVGSGIGFSDLGPRELKGVPGTWSVVLVEPHGPTSGTREAELVSIPTPSPASAMRRMDRVAGVLARRTPRLSRSAVRLAPKVWRDGRP